MSLSLSLTRNALIAASLCLALIACDRQADTQAQEQGALNGAKKSLSGELDHSHAGELLPAVNVVDGKGNEINLAALQGQPVLLNLWATWCAPCVVEMPMLDDLADDLADDLPVDRVDGANAHVRIVTVSQDLKGAEKVDPFFAKMQFRNLEPWTDSENALGFAVGGGVLPTTVLYDSSGQEVWRVVGEYDWSSAEALEAIRAGVSE